MSEREEEFQDLPMALSGRTGLEDALKNSYVETETLDGANQYHCSICNQLVDAKRVYTTLGISTLLNIPIISYSMHGNHFKRVRSIPERTR